MKHEEDKPKKKVRHAPNKLGVGMKILNEHDADEQEGFEMNPDLDDYDEAAKFLKEDIDEEILNRYLKR
jgi:hypothetical protein